MKQHFFTTCVECGRSAKSHSGVCQTCDVEHGYAQHIWSDECQCVTCRSDLARIVPCDIARPEAVERVAWLIANEGVRL